MRSIESEGDTIDEAIERALGTLRVGRDQVEVEILSDAAKGLLGFGGKKARVRATIRAPLTSRLREDRDNDSRETEDRPNAPVAPVPESLGRRAREVLAEVLGYLGASSTIDVHPGDEAGVVVLDVRGDNGGLLIGRRGQTLDALEYIVNRIVGRDEDGGGRVVIEVERYRERRREYLSALAQRLADKARTTGRIVTLNPMSPRDRRIVHMALQSDAGVTTQSQGDGHYRRVLIVPAGRQLRQPKPIGA